MFKLAKRHLKVVKKVFGQKMNLGKVSTHPRHDNENEVKWINSRGKEYIAKIKVWNNMLLRGSRKYNSSKHPMNLIQVQILDKNMENVHKRPLWLCVLGSKRHEVSSIPAVCARDLYTPCEIRLKAYLQTSFRNLLFVYKC